MMCFVFGMYALAQNKNKSTNQSRTTAIIIPYLLGCAEGNFVILIFIECLIFDYLGLRFLIKHPKRQGSTIKEENNLVK